MRTLLLICLLLIFPFWGYAWQQSQADLVATAAVTSPSKCGRSTGAVVVSVEGGSGQYTYSTGTTTPGGLPAGPGFVGVTDALTGAVDTAFYDIPVVTAEAVVAATVHLPNCAGQFAFVAESVIPGNYFKLPYSFSLQTADGLPVANAGTLLPGDYLMWVADADSCVLPAVPFTVGALPPISLSGTLQQATCDAGGSVALQLSGGTGTLLSDWEDLPGPENGATRTHLPRGRYRVNVYDSLFCQQSAEFLVSRACGRRDTFHLLVPKGGVNSFCAALPHGFSAQEGTFQLLGSAAGSVHGSWSLQENCLQYQALQTVGFGVDVICLTETYPSLNAAGGDITDTLCIRVHILEQPATQQTVHFTVQVNQNALACGLVPNYPGPRQLVPLNIPAVNGVAEFGTYAVDPADACLTYSAFDTPKFFADSMAVAVCDQQQHICHVIAYVASVLPWSDCSGGILDIDSLSLPTIDCVAGAEVCLDIPFNDVGNYNVFDNRKPFFNFLTGCNEVEVVRYTVDLNAAPLFGNGPYQLLLWAIEDIAYGTPFATLEELAAFMKAQDPLGNWHIENGIYITGGVSGMLSSYSFMAISNGSGQTTEFPAVILNNPRGSVFRFDTGEHFVTFKRIQTGCSDTLRVGVTCYDCPPIHTYPADQFGNIAWEAPSCAGDTLLLTQIPFVEVADWAFFAGNIPVPFTIKDGLIAFRFDTGYHLIKLYNKVTTCSYNLSFFYDCRNAPVDTLTATVRVNQQIAVCPDQQLLAPPVITVFNICSDHLQAPNVSVEYDEVDFCALLTGLSPGTDTLCLQLCNADGACATTLVWVTVTSDGDNLVVYNGISPNGDGKNDFWTIEGITALPDNEVWVYNRWGNEVFHQKSYDNTWDGSWNEAPLPAGTYYYVIDPGNGGKVQKGSLTIAY